MEQQIDSVASLDKAIATRKPHQKVRTGCRTCKIRRLKCDETKPACLRCIRSKYICEGYSIFVSTPDPNLKFGHSNSPMHEHSIKPADSFAFYRTLQSLTELSEREYNAYDFCRQNAVHNIASYHLTQFWTHTVLSAAQNEPAILHAMLALSGAYRSYCDSQSGNRFGPSNDIMTPAYIHYGKAVHYLQARIARTNREELHVVLIVCLVLLTFDIIQGRYRESSVHLGHGREILKKLHSNTPVDKGAFNLYLPEKPESVLDELSYFFALMDLQSIYFDSKIQFKLVDKPNVDETPRAKIPLSFGTFDDAWRSLLLLSNGVYHFGSDVLEPKNRACGYNQRLVTWQSYLLTELRQWKAAFDNSSFRTPVSRTASPSLGDQRPVALQLNHTYLTIVVRIALSHGDNMVYDSLMPQFSKLVGLCEDLVTGLPSISLESYVIEPLFTTGCSCRHPGLRRRALRALSCAGKEGHWDSKLIEIVSREKMILEEEQAGYIYDPEFPVSEDADLATIIPCNARWSESWAFFLSEDYTLVELAFRRRKHDGQSLPGEDQHEVTKKILRLDQ